MASLGTQAAGAGMATVGAFFGAKSQKSGLRFQANIADINAKIAEMNARDLIRSGIIEESRIKMAGSQAKSSQIVKLAGSGVDINSSPTAQAVLAGTDLITAVDAQTMRGNALRAAWGQRFEAGDQRRKALALRATAKGISPGLAGFTSLLTGVSQVAGSWYQMDKAGMFDKQGGKTGSVSINTPALDSFGGGMAPSSPFGLGSPADDWTIWERPRRTGRGW